MSRGHKQETYRKRNTNSLQARSIQDMNTKKMSPCNTVKHPRPVKVSTHLEPDILEHEVNWALGSIATSKASGGDGIPVELFQILKDSAVKVLHSICQQIWKTQQWPQDWKWSVFIPIPKKGNAKECSNYCTIALISHASKFSKPGFNSPDVQAGFRKGRGTRDQIANIRWIIEKARKFQKNIYFCFIDYAKAFDYVDHNIL